VLQLLYGAISTGEAQRGESRLTTEGNGGIRAWDLLITVETAEEQVVRLNGLGLDFHLEGEEVWVMGDRVVLRRVFLNMLKNAREASGPGDKVSVRIKEDGGRVKIGIHNPAVMPPAVRSQVFQRSFSTKGSGRGLGTYSIKLFTTNYMNGNITFRSEKGFGTEFILDIPVSPRDS
jgi:signal transduction histidine kinase